MNLQYEKHSVAILEKENEMSRKMSDSDFSPTMSRLNEEELHRRIQQLEKIGSETELDNARLNEELRTASQSLQNQKIIYGEL